MASNLRGIAMFIARSVLVAALLVQGAFIGAVGADASEFKASEAVSSTVIRSKGYDLKLSDGTIVKLTGAAVTQQPQKDCLVHIPSLRLEIENGLKAGTLRPIGSAAQEVKLQVRVTQEGNLWCFGGGTGCTIGIQ
jgi:hypothetical protein